MDKKILDSFSRMEKLRRKYGPIYWTLRSPEGPNYLWTVQIMCPKMKFSVVASRNHFDEAAKSARLKFRKKMKEMKNG